MRKLLFALAFILVLLFPLAKVARAEAPADPRCLSFNVTFTAKNWSGGSIDIGCQGLNKPPCTGGIISIRPKPGKKYTLNNCACPENNKGVFKGWADGCLYVAKKLKPIKRSDSKNRPGVDVDQPLSANCSINAKKFVKISNGFYKTKPGSCGLNKTEVDVPIKISCPGPSSTPTPTPTPTPSSCPTPAPVLNVKIKCPNCKEASPSPVSSSPVGVAEDQL